MQSVNPSAAAILEIGSADYRPNGASYEKREKHIKENELGIQQLGQEKHDGGHQQYRSHKKTISRMHIQVSDAVCDVTTEDSAGNHSQHHQAYDHKQWARHLVVRQLQADLTRRHKHAPKHQHFGDRA